MASNANAQAAYRDLVASGLTPGAAVGVVGNLIAESGLDPGARGDSGLAYGIAQWHPDRQANLRKWSASHGGNPSTLKTQLGFAVYEAKQLGVWAHLQGVTDPVKAAGIWMREFERPKDQSQTNAIRRAKLGQEALAGASSGGGSVLDAVSGLAGDVGEFIAGGAIKWPSALIGGVQQIGSAATSVGSLFEHLLWWFNPGHVLRVIVGGWGVLFILLGLMLLTREVRA